MIMIINKRCNTGLNLNNDNLYLEETSSAAILSKKVGEVCLEGAAKFNLVAGCSALLVSSTAAGELPTALRAPAIRAEGFRFVSEIKPAFDICDIAEAA